ncbi:MAG TPA: hypothetical protein VF980_17265 [Thermoanaerobaculia bacterium]
MIVVATIFRIVDGFLEIVLYAILIWVVLSWIDALTQRSSARWRYRRLFAIIEAIDRFLRMFLSPFLRLSRRIIPQRILPREWSFIDFSPLILSVLIIILRAVLTWVYGRILIASVTGG